jgi:hypothetical protein
MKKWLSWAVLLALVGFGAGPSGAAVDIRVSIPLPPLIVFPQPPEVIVIPETYVYFVPHIEEEVFFHDGWWWRPWQGRWYRSRHYDSGWAYYKNVPSFYVRLHSGWRDNYRLRRWKGNPWTFAPIPHQRLQQHWSAWKKDKYWEKKHGWHVQGLRDRPPSRGDEPRRVMPSQRIEPIQPHSPREAQPRSAVKSPPHQPREVKPKSQSRPLREGEPQGRVDRGPSERSERR